MLLLLRLLLLLQVLLLLLLLPLQHCNIPDRRHISESTRHMYICLRRMLDKLTFRLYF